MENSKTIIIVEDEGVVALDLKNRLTALGYEVPEIFDNGKDLLERGPDYFPNLIIMDVMIKGDYDGIQTANKFRQILDVPIIFLTAYSDDQTFQRAKFSEAYAFLLKPFEQRELETAIEIAFFRHLLTRKLKIERQQFFDILSTMKDAVIATDDKELITYYNPAANSLFSLDKNAYPLTQSKNLSITSLLPFLRTITQNPDLIQNILNGTIKQYSLDNVKIKWDEKELAFDLFLLPMHDEDFEVNGMVLVAHDVSEKLKFIENLQKSERKYRSLFERNLAGVVQTSLDGLILACNDAFANIFGYQYAYELIGKDAHQFYFTPIERKALMERLLQTGSLTNIELLLKRKDGKTIWILENIHLFTTITNQKIIEATLFDITTKKSLEDELKKSQSNLLSLIENTQSIICSINKNFELISYNNKYAETFYDILGFYPKPGIELSQILEKFIPQWQEYFDVAFQGTQFIKEISFSHKGQTLFFEIHFTPVFVQGEINAVTIYANDITEKKTQQIEKQRTLDLLNAVFNQSADGLFIINTEGKILDCNQKAADILGYPSKYELINDNTNEILIPKEYRISILKKLFQNNTWNGEIQYSRNDLKTIWCDVSFNYIKVVNEPLILLRISDITEKKEAERMRILLENAIQNTSDAILIMDNQNPPHIIFANHAYFELSKKNPMDVLNKPYILSDRLTQQIPKEIFDKIYSLERVHFEFENLKANGEKYLAEIDISPIKSTHNNLYWLIVMRDITEKRKQEQELMEAKINQQQIIMKTIVDTQEMERERFAEDLHDSLGQMLSALKINLSALSTHLHDPNPIQLYEKSKNLLDTAIQEVRNISHSLMPSSLEQLGLNAALSELCRIMNNPNKIQIFYQTFGKEIPLDKSYEITFYRVAQELINNAFKHSNAKTIHLQLFFHPDLIVMMFEDDGQGFDLEKIKAKSRGIGLKNIEHRIKLIHGNVFFETAQGKGFLCTIEVPLAFS